MARLYQAKFPASFAGDVSPEEAAFMADSQVPLGVNALGGTISEAAWKAKPSWYLLTTEDRMIPPDQSQARIGGDQNATPRILPVCSSLVKDLRPCAKGCATEHTAIGLAPRSSRFQKPEGRRE